MSFQLRQYQIDIVAKARELMLGGTHTILIQSPTGSGKTALTANMLATAAGKGMPSWFIVHRRELVKQSVRAFNAVGIRAGIVAAGFLGDNRSIVQIASVQTLAKRYKNLPRPKLIVWDECHHLAAGSWAKIFIDFPEAFHIGLTATPQRLDGRGLDKWFQKMINGPSVSWLINNKFLAPYKLFAPQGIDTSSIHTRMGDFAQNELAAAADKPTITGDAIKHYLKYASGKRAVVFCVSVEHSKHVVSQFLGAGIPAEHVDGETNPDERDASIRRFESGKTIVLSNVELFGEGFDLPAIEVGILLRPTQSLGLYLQQVGRVLRPSPNKHFAVILDHAGNCQRHGLPDDERTWSLQGRGVFKGASNSASRIRVCPKCFAAQNPGTLTCKHCGYVFAVDSRKIEHVDGELVEVDTAKIRQERKQEQADAKTFQELVELGKSRNYKNPYTWAKHLFNARQYRKIHGIQGRED